MSSLLHNVDIPTKKATFAMGCFWGPDSLFGAKQGVIRTRVGYAGGSKVNPTYHGLGDHTEAIDIDYDPKEITYASLLDLFWDNHDPTAKTSVQYTSLIFYHDEEQKKLAEVTLEEREQKRNRGYFVTKVIPFKEFYNAEDYHQKYRLQQHSYLMNAIGLKSGPQLLTSHLAARLNGYVVGFGGVAQFESEVGKLGLDEKTAHYHQKYRLRQHPYLMNAIGLKSGPHLITSHLAACLNGYVVGFGGVAQFDTEVEKLGLDGGIAQYIRELVQRHEGQGLTC